MNADDSLKYKIVFKGFVNLNNTKILFVETRARAFSNQGHQFGYEDVYYLISENETWKIQKSFPGQEPYPIGDSDEINIVKVGKDNYARISIFSSTGNQQYERNANITLLLPTSLEYIGELDLDYSNEAWIQGDGNQADRSCRIKSYESSFQINESQNKWFTITVNRKTKHYSKGCKEEQSKSEQFTYYFDGKKYILLKK